MCFIFTLILNFDEKLKNPSTLILPTEVEVGEPFEIILCTKSRKNLHVYLNMLYSGYMRASKLDGCFAFTTKFEFLGLQEIKILDFTEHVLVRMKGEGNENIP